MNSVKGFTPFLLWDSNIRVDIGLVNIIHKGDIYYPYTRKQALPQQVSIRKK